MVLAGVALAAAMPCKNVVSDREAVWQGARWAPKTPMRAAVRAAASIKGLQYHQVSALGCHAVVMRSSQRQRDQQDQQAAAAGY